MSDKYVSLGDRVEFANNFGADYFLSIHINSASGVGETLHVANDMTLATASVTSVAQNIIYASLNPLLLAVFIQLIALDLSI